MEAMPLPHLTCFPKDPVRVIVFFCNILSWQRTWEIPALMGIYIFHIYMSDEQNPRRGVLYKRMIGVCCCNCSAFCLGAQESARAGARYINIVFFSVSVNICCCSGSELVGRTDGTIPTKTESNSKRYGRSRVYTQLYTYKNDSQTALSSRKAALRESNFKRYGRRRVYTQRKFDPQNGPFEPERSFTGIKFPEAW